MNEDYMLTEDQKSLQGMVREFAQKEVKPICREAEKTAEIPWDLVRKAQSMGLHLLKLPEEYGGLGLSNFTYTLLREELAKGDVGFAATIFGFGFAPAEVAGNNAQKEMMAEIIRNGGFTAFALTESHSGSNAAAIRTTAKRDGDNYILNGSKCFISHGSFADITTVIAVTDGEKGTKGMSAFLVPKGLKGFEAGKKEDKMGMRVANVVEQFFDEVRVPAKYRLGEEGEGFSIAMRILDRVRPTAGASAVGLAQSAMEAAIEYAKQREVFGHAIMDFQGISFLIADMEIQIQAARQLTWSVARAADAGVFDRKLSAIAKCFASDMAMKVTTDAVQVFGGNGYSKEYPVEKLMRDAKIFQIFEGTNQIQRTVIAKQLFK